MKWLISIFLVLSFFITGQQSVQSQYRSQTTDLESISHDHSHSLFTEFKMTVLGILIHNHEHEHEDSSPWSNSHSQDSKSHSHGDVSSLKFEIINQRTVISFYDSAILLRPYFNSNLKSFDFQSEIFRPPIAT